MSVEIATWPPKPEKPDPRSVEWQILDAIKENTELLRQILEKLSTL